MSERGASGEGGVITRRALLAGGAAAAAGTTTLIYGRVPAWARPIASAAALRKPDSLPYPRLPAGHPTPGLGAIEHVVVLMLENHSFDNLLGMVPHQVRGRRRVDGFRFGRRGKPIDFNPTAALPSVSGPNVYAALASSPCQKQNVTQSWNASHLSWNHGANNGFVQQCTAQAMWYWDERSMPFTYSLAQYFPIGERYFSSVLAQTYPNRRFFFCGTASGLTATNDASYSVPAANGTIFDRLLAHGVSWLNYVQPTGHGTLDASAIIVPNFSRSKACLSRIKPISQFFTDAKHGKLQSFSFIDPNYTTTSEEDPQDIQAGEQFVASVVSALTHSPLWSKTALFLTYDEHGGYYDHVPPPPAIKPDTIVPNQTYANPGQTLVPGGYDRYGFRVPLLVISAWARPGYASRVIQDHTSIAAFVERKWNLPAMSFRDANAHPMTDYFDFRGPTFLHPPKLAAAPALGPGLQECTAAGLTPPAGTPRT
ncbi:MAG: alkaline phosphatase family protein [Solirubrobacteraceae bacterium]